MSGAIKRSVAPIVARLRGYLSHIPRIHIEAEADPEIAAAAYNTYVQEARLILHQIETAIQHLERYNDKWIEFISHLEGAEYERANREFEEMAEDERGLLKILDQAKETSVTLALAIESAKKSLLHISGPADRLPQQNTPQSASPTQVQLPKLSLPQFTGGITEWLSFWSAFNRSIHSTNLDDADKLAYLLGSLQGSARKLVSGFTVTGTNYPIVLKLLQQKYGDDEMIRIALRRQLKDLPPVRRDTDLIPTLTAIENVLQQMDSLGSPAGRDYVESLVEEKLPFWVVDKLYEEKEKASNWSVQDLRQFLRSTSNRRERVHYIIKEQQTGKNQPNNLSCRTRKIKNPKESNQTISTMALPQKPATAKRPSQPKTPCSFCDGVHFNDACTRYPALQERMKRIKERRLCKRCLKRSHSTRECSTKIRPCFYCKSDEHVSALCNARVTQTKPKAAQTTSHWEQTNKENNTTVPTMSVKDCQSRSLLMCKEVEVHNPRDPLKVSRVLIFFDPGSQRSYINEDLARQLCLVTEPSSPLLVLTFKARKPLRLKSKQTSIAFKHDKGTLVVRLNTVRDMTKALPDFEVVDLPQSFTGGIPIDRNETFKRPEILIGIDYFFEFFISITRASGSLFIIQTIIGPVLAGREDIKKPEQAQKTAIFTVTDIQQFWDLETIGIAGQSEDEVAYQLFSKSIQKQADGRYSVGWPWRETKRQLSPTFGLCYGRLRSLLDHLNRHQELLREYDQTFKNQIEQGIIEPAPQFAEGIVHYLPHQMVLTPHKTTKLRIVYDASAACGEGVSLNDNLYRGPILLPHLVGVLLRARALADLLVADVEKAFLQVGLHSSDRDVTRFLWVKRIDRPLDKDNLVIYRFTRVLFGVSSSPFLLAAVIRFHLEHSKDELAKKILRNSYVDNVILGFSNTHAAHSAYQRTKELFNDALMNLRNYASNSQAILETIPKNDQHPDRQISLLGLGWKTDDDYLELQLHKLPNEPLTKRKVVHFVGTHFDPLGLISPLLLQWKLFVQKLWKLNLDWDEPIQNDHEEIQKTIKTLKTWREGVVKVPRKAMAVDRSTQLHLFVDASTTAYAATIYATYEGDVGLESNLIFCKSRLLPLKTKLTIPKAELMGAWIGTKALNFVREHLDVGSVPCYAWTDSKCVIEWIDAKGSKTLPPFVRNRVKFIQEAGVKFRYVPTADNPADLASRGLSQRQFSQAVNWWHGPGWLTESESQWPSIHQVQQPNPSNSTTRDHQEYSNALMITDATETIVDWSITNCYQRLLRIWENVIEFGLRAQKARGYPLIRDSVVKTRAELFLTQEAHKGISRTDIEKWDLRKDADGLWRVDLLTGQHQPVFLNSHHPLTRLLILNAHEKCGHFGVSWTLTEFRTKYWTEKGRSTVPTDLARRVFEVQKGKCKALPSTANVPPAPRENNMLQTIPACSGRLCGPLPGEAPQRNTQKAVGVSSHLHDHKSHAP